MYLAELPSFLHPFLISVFLILKFASISSLPTGLIVLPNSLLWIS